MKKFLLIFISFFTVQLTSAVLPYSIIFSDGLEGWSVVDKNNDGLTWSFGSDSQGNTGMYYTVGEVLADDWLISPRFKLEKGKRYAVCYVAKDEFPVQGDKLKLWLGNGSSVESFSTLLSERTPRGTLKDSVAFTADITGTYSFAIQNNSSRYNGQIVITQFMLKEIAETTEEQHLLTFDVDKLGEWTILDVNSDGSTWGNIDGIKGITCPMSFQLSDDWLITKGFSVKGGKAYNLTYDMKVTAGGFDPEKVDVFSGTVATVAGMTTVIQKEEFRDGTRKVIKFVPETSGTYYIGFHRISPPFLGNLSLTEAYLDEFQVAPPLAVTNLTGTSKKAESKVTLTWINPMNDANNMPIADELDLKIYRNDVLIKALKGASGVSMTCEDSPFPYSGISTYEIVPCISSTNGPTTKVSVDLDDVQGTLMKVYYSDFTNQVDLGAWTVVDANNDGVKWVPDYYNAKNDVMKLSWVSPSACNDWLISPKVRLEAGKRYVMSYDLKTSRDFPSDMEITLGTDQTPEGHTRVLKSYPDLKINGFQTLELEQFEVKKTGDYYIGFRCTNIRNNTYMRNLKISYVKSDPIKHLHTFDVTNLDEWTVSDANSDNNTWKKQDGIDGITYPGSDQAGNDWLITKGFQVEVGKAYVLGYTLNLEEGRTNAEKVMIYSGTSPSAAVMTTLLKSEEFSQGIEHFVAFAPNTTGTLYIGFHEKSLANGGTVSLIETYVDEYPVIAPKAVTNFNATPDGMASTVALTWVNPILNINGGEIVDKLDLRIFRDDLLVNEMTGIRGIGMSWDDSPSPYSGVHTYKVVPIILGTLGEGVSTSVDLDAVPRPDEHLCTFKINKLEEWTMIDTNTDGNTWKKIDGVGGITYAGTAQSGSDWLITKEFPVEVGKVYELTYSLSVTDAKSVAERVEIYFGSSAEAASMTTLLKSEEFREGVRHTVRFKSGISGNLRFGFRECSPANGGSVSLTEAYVDNYAVIAPEQVLNLNADQDKVASKVTLKWTNPIVDIEGEKIMDEMDLQVYRDNELVKTLTSTAGALMTCEDSPSPYSGIHTYRIVSSIFGVSEGDASISVNLDHLYTFDVNRLEDWIVLDINADNFKWGKVEGTDGITYPKGQNKADDWLISESFTVEAYKPYTLTYTLQASEAADKHKVKVFFGTAANETMEFEVKTEEFKGTARANLKFIPNMTGTYYMGFHAMSPATAGNVSLTEAYIDRLPDVVASPVINLRAVLTPEKSKVQILWTNPATDVNGNNLVAGDLFIHVYFNNEVVSVFTAMPGVEESYEATVTPYTGIVEYKIVPYVDNYPGQEAKISIDLSGSNIKVQENSDAVKYNASTSELCIDSRYNQVQIFDLSGRMVIEDHSGANVVNLSSLLPGTYVAKIYTSEKNITLKLIKN